MPGKSHVNPMPMDAASRLPLANRPPIFVSAEITGNGAAQSTPHSLGATPRAVIVSVSELPDAAAETGFDVAEGVHDATNAIVTVTNTVKYKIIAFS